jgi:hypothetical protein
LIAADTCRCGWSTMPGGLIVMVAKKFGVVPFVRPVMGL